MKKTFLKLFIINFIMLSLTVNVFAANNAQSLYDGVTYNEEHIINTDGKNADVFSLTVDLTKAYTICGLPDNIKALQVGSKGQQTLSEMVAAAQRDGYTVYAAMNADFFCRFDENKIQPEGMVIRDGKLLNPIGSYNSFYGVMKNGKAFIGHIYDYTNHLGEFDQAVSGDYGALIKNGEAITEDKQGGWHAVGDTEPRAAVGIKKDGTVFMVVVDGRSDKSDGLTLTQLANYMKENGCVTAINLDGGGSAQMGICDPETQEFKIVNSPSDGQERPIANAILVVSDREPNVPAKAPVSNTPKIIVTVIGFTLVALLYVAAFVINLKNKRPNN
ncbi:MAG: phosphodiester glycosidase family protein [Clostridia bacterium]|nr:phosphodiester glycosidase family protein [Clostridia bacterium]